MLHPRPLQETQRHLWKGRVDLMRRSDPKSRSAVPGPPLRPMRVRTAASCILGMAVAVWWVTGDLYEPVGAKLLLEGPGGPSALEHGVGVIGLCTTLVSLVALISNREQRERERRWRPVFGVFLAVGAPMLGFGVRVAVAPSLGGNIGAGLFLIFGLPIGALVTLWAALRADSLVTQTVPERMRPPT